MCFLVLFCLVLMYSQVVLLSQDIGGCGLDSILTLECQFWLLFGSLGIGGSVPECTDTFGGNEMSF